MILVLWSAVCSVCVSSTITDNVLGTGENTQKGTFRLIGNGGRNQVRRPRPSLSAPPYAVPMEPVFKYSQRDPLYDRGSVKNISNVEATSISSKADYDVEQTKNILKRLPFGNRGRRPSHPKPHYHHRPPPQHHHYPYYPEPPEPIIEIIIKESNISLPAPTTTPPPPTTKEPIHVFYVKYKKNPNPSDHGDEIIYEEPVPALNPTATEIVEGEQPNYGPTYAEPVGTPAPPPSTTLRTIIRPDSETYHGSGLKVTFGGPEHEHPQEVYGQSAPQPQVALPEEKEDVESEETTVSNKNHYKKRQQGPYQQKEVKQELPSYQLQQSEQLQYREEVPLQPPPLPLTNHRFPGPSNQRFFNREVTRISNHQQTQHQIQQQSPNLQNGFQFQNGPQNIPPTSVASTQSTQHSDRSFVQPTQFLQPTSLYQKQQFESNENSRQRIPTPTSVTDQQIQEYQQHKEFLIQQNAKQQHDFHTLQGQITPQVPSTINPGHFVNNYQNNQQISNQRSQPPPQIHVEQSPIIEQSDVSQRINPQLEAFKQFTSNQNPDQQPYKFEDSNYGQRLREKNNANNEKRHESLNGGKGQFFPSQPVNNYNGEVNSKVPNAEIIKSISSLEDHQIQPASNFPPNVQINPTVSTQNYNYNHQPTESIYRIRNRQPVTAQPTVPTLTNVRYNVRNDNEQRRKQNYNVPSSEATYTFRNSQSSNGQQNINNRQQSTDNERQSEKSNINKYLTVYSRPQNAQQRRPTTPAPIRNDPPSTYATPTEQPRAEQSTPETKPDKAQTEEEEARKKANIAALPDEVPEDLREQLLSSGILGNADIQILDYDKVGDIPIESLPPEALENFYGAASDPVPSVVKPHSEKKAVEMRVVRYDPNSDEAIPNKYFQENATKIDPVFLNDSKYKRYLPLRVSGAQFPIPDVPQLKDRLVNSVVVLAPVDYDFIKTQEDADDSRRGRIIQIQGVKFVVGDSLMQVIKNPSQENYKQWLQNEMAVPTEKQSVVLLVTKGEGENADKEEIFMYEIEKESVRKLRGELSSTFVELANSNSESEDLERLGEGVQPQSSA